MAFAGQSVGAGSPSEGFLIDFDDAAGPSSPPCHLLASTVQENSSTIVVTVPPGPLESRPLFRSFSSEPVAPPSLQEEEVVQMEVLLCRLASQVLVVYKKQQEGVPLSSAEKQVVEEVRRILGSDLQDVVSSSDLSSYRQDLKQLLQAGDVDLAQMREEMATLRQSLEIEVLPEITDQRRCCRQLKILWRALRYPQTSCQKAVRFFFCSLLVHCFSDYCIFGCCVFLQSRGLDLKGILKRLGCSFLQDFCR